MTTENSQDGDPTAPGEPSPGGISVAQRSALDALFSATYEELRRLALLVRRRESSVSLSPTVLVNEAWLKLSRSPELAFESQLHFKRTAARAMRQLLVEAARRRASLKRGGDEGNSFVTFDESIHQHAVSENELIALDAALDELEQSAPRQALMIEYRFFGGLEVAETAALLGISEATLMRDWRTAKAWLALALRKAH